MSADHGAPTAPPVLGDPHCPQFPHPPIPARAVLDRAGELLRALSAPVRMGIVLMLRDHDCCVHELVECLEAPQPLISQHLRVLKECGVVDGTRVGREVRYRLVDPQVCEIVTAAARHGAAETHGDRS